VILGPRWFGIGGLPFSSSGFGSAFWVVILFSEGSPRSLARGELHQGLSKSALLL